MACAPIAQAAASFGVADLPISESFFARRQPVELGERQADEQANAIQQDVPGDWRNALRFCSSLPSTAAGSGTPQCAVIGWPGQTGQTSPAALSQTVNTKSSGGEPGCANSSQFLLRIPSVGSRLHAGTPARTG